MRPRFSLNSVWTLGAAAALAISSSAPAQQASITLTNSDAQFCYAHENVWTLTKTVSSQTAVSNGAGDVFFDVKAVKSSGLTTFTVVGGLTVTNTGSADAPIGNIVINLQRPLNVKVGGKNVPWVSVAANVATATAGDAAISANIVAAGSAENAAANLVYGPANYATSNQGGTFTETPGRSGSLNFTDAQNNTAFSLVPQPVIPAGQAVTLLYQAEFECDCLPPAGTPLRVEALVSFGNAGARGGSGASASGIDVDGNGVLDNYVRTVPSRVTTAPLPTAPVEHNNMVTVSDPGVTTTGTVTTSNPIGFDALPAEISSDATWTVCVTADAGALGGFVLNEATLVCPGDSITLGVIVGYDNFGMPIYATVQCCPGLSLNASASYQMFAAVPAEEPPAFQQGQYVTYSQGGYGNGNGNGVPAQLLANYFAQAFPAGFVEVGIPGTGGYSMKFTSAANVKKFWPKTGKSGALTADTVNAQSTSSGTFGAQVLALKINVMLSGLATPGGFGNLYYNNPGDSLHGLTIAQILAQMEIALGGGALPPGYTYSTLNELADNLNLSFHEGSVSAWAIVYLSTTAPAP